MAGRLQSYMLANLQFHPIMDYDYQASFKPNSCLGMLFSKWYLCLAAIFFNRQSTLPLLMLDGLMSHLDANLTNLYAPAPASFLWLLVCFFGRGSLLFHLVFALGFTCFQSCLTAPAGIVPISSRQPSRAFWNAHSPLRGTNVRQHEGNLAVTLLAWFHNLECNVLTGLLNGTADIHYLDTVSRYIHSYIDVSIQNTDIRSLVVLFLKDWSTKKLPASIFRHSLLFHSMITLWICVYQANSLDIRLRLCAGLAMRDSGVEP